MGAVADVVALVRSLEGRGWGPTFSAHGIDLADVHDAAGLLADRPGIDRTRLGFEDFAEQGRRLLEPGDPALSLLHHALAHPGVHPSADGKGIASETAYPTLAELDLVENAVYALDTRPLPAGGLVAAVFAYQYREATRTPHGLHADMVFARSGIARVGEAAAAPDAPARAFQALTPDGRFRVRPGRFGVFLCEAVDVDDVSLMGGRQRFDGWRKFLKPRRKVFDGPDCLPGRDVRIEWAMRHRDEKLRRAVTHGRLRPPGGFNLAAPPFLYEGDDHPDLAVRVRVGASLLVASPPGPLAEPARQRNRRSGKDEIVRVRVPKQTWPFAELNRRFTTLHLLGNLLRAGLDVALTLLRGRAAYFMPRHMPEFVNMRHQVRGGDLIDLGATLGADYGERLARGGYEAALFEDGLNEGCVSATLHGVGPQAVRARPAWSLITAPDFFPEVDQMDLHSWVEEREDELSSTFSNGGPEPLCLGRLGVNPALTLPGSRRVRAFPPGEKTLVAVYAVRREGPAHRVPGAEPRMSTWLPDAAGNVFAPGWDCTYDGVGLHSFYCAYGLGSPFPEDVKLCAAGAGSWAAVSPDASRTFRRSDTPTAIPLTDEELGTREARGWDGEYGPFLESHEGHVVVNYADIDRSDYVSNARAGRWNPRRLEGVNSTELIARMDGLRRCLARLPAVEPRASIARRFVTWVRSWFRRFGGAGAPGTTRLWLVSLAASGGDGHRWVFAETSDDGHAGVDPVADLPRRRRARVRRLWHCRTDLSSSDATVEEVVPPAP